MGASWAAPPQNNCCFEVLSSLILHNNNEPFLDWIVIYREEWVLPRQPEMISSVAGSKRSSKARPKAKVHQKKVMVTVWWSAAGLIHYSFLIPAKPLYLRSMLSKLLRCTRNCNACSRHWSTERAPFSTMPDCTWHNQHLSWTNWATKYCLICHIHLTSCQPPLLQGSEQLSAGETLPQSAGGRKWFPRVHWIPKHGFLCYRNKQTYFLLAKMCCYNSSYFD